MLRNRKARRAACSRIEFLEQRRLLNAALNINASTHALSYVDTAGFSNSLTVEVVAGVTPMLQFTETNSFDSITLGTSAINLGWTSPSAGVVTGPESSVSSMLIDTNDSSDTTVIKSADVPITIAPTNGSSSDEVDLGGANGDKGFSEAITAQVTIQNASGGTQVVVNDAGDATARHVTANDTGVSGLTAVPIVFDAKTTNVKIDTGDTSNTVDLTNSAAAKLWVLEDGADDTVNIHALAAASTALVGGINGGHVSVNISNSGTLAAIKGNINLNSPDLFPTVTIDDSADTVAKTVTIGDDGNITGLTANPIEIGSSFVTNMVIDGGTGGNTIVYNRQNNAVNPFADNVVINSGTGNDTVYVVQNRVTSVTVNGQGGTDTVKLGVTPTSTPGTGSMTAFFGATNITNANGSTTIDVDDSNEVFAHTISVSDSILNKLTTTPITYSNVSNVNVIGENLLDSFVVFSSPTTAFNVDGGPFTGAPADTLFVDTTLALTPVLNEQNTGNGLSGTYTFSNRKTVTFSRFGSVLGGVSGKVLSILSGTPLPNTKLFLDLNNNGALDPSDPTATTDSLGNYAFQGIIPGAYQVIQAAQAGDTQVAAAPQPVTVTAGLITVAPLITDAPPAVASGPDLKATLALLPSKALIGGAAGKLKLTITNAGTVVAVGSPHVALFASSTSTLDASNTSIGSFSLGKLKLKPGASKTILISFKYPKTLATGSYFVLASVDSSNVISEADETNNIAASASAVPITAAVVDLAGKLGHLPKSFKAGSAAALPLTIQNLGNSAATGSMDVQIFSSSDQSASDGVLVFEGSVPLNIKAHGSKPVTLHIPAHKTVAGSRFLVVQLNANQAVAESNFANDTLVSSSAVTFT